MRYCGRHFEAVEIDLIRELIAMQPLQTIHGNGSNCAGSIVIAALLHLIGKVAFDLQRLPGVSTMSAPGRKRTSFSANQLGITN